MHGVVVASIFRTLDDKIASWPNHKTFCGFSANEYTKSEKKNEAEEQLFEQSTF